MQLVDQMLAGSNSVVYVLKLESPEKSDTVCWGSQVSLCLSDQMMLEIC